MINGRVTFCEFVICLPMFLLNFLGLAVELASIYPSGLKIRRLYGGIGRRGIFISQTKECRYERSSC